MSHDEPPTKRAKSSSIRVIVAKTPDSIPSVPVDGKPTCVYWDICGLAQPIRMSLALAGVEDFVDVRIDAGDVNDDASYKQVWMKRKPELQEVMAFPNLPYYLDGSVVLSQSNAILRHIGRQHGLLGPSGKEHIVDLALDQLVDLDSGFVRRAYGMGGDALVAWCREEVPALLAQWDRLLGKEDGGPFLCGAKPTVADVKLYETLRKIEIVEKELVESKEDDGPAIIGSSPVRKEFMRSIEALPRIKEYMESESYLQRPLNNPHAKFV